MSEQEFKWVPEGFNWNYTGEEPSVVQLPMTQQHYPPAVQYSPTGWYYPQQPPEHKARGTSYNLGFMILAIASGLVTVLGTLGSVLAAFEAPSDQLSGKLAFAVLFFAWGAFWTILWAAFGTFTHKGRGR